MDETSRLNEHIAGIRNALAAVCVLSVLVFLTSVDRVYLAQTIASFDRFLVELVVLENDERFPVELGDGIDPYSDYDLGLSSTGVFGKLAHYRYALPSSFHFEQCGSTGYSWGRGSEWA